MKFSEAVLLGSTMIRPIPYYKLSKDMTAGCALGMAEVAVGRGSIVYPHVIDEWPWLELSIDRSPCGCFYPGQRVKIDFYANAVAHIFNEHVCGDGTWTLEKLVDWIRSVEPEEEVEVQETEAVDARHQTVV